MKSYVGKAFLAVGIAHGKALKEELPWCIYGIERPVWQIILFGSSSRQVLSHLPLANMVFES